MVHIEAIVGFRALAKLPIKTAPPSGDKPNWRDSQRAFGLLLGQLRSTRLSVVIPASAPFRVKTILLYRTSKSSACGQGLGVGLTGVAVKVAVGGSGVGLDQGVLVATGVLVLVGSRVIVGLRGMCVDCPSCDMTIKGIEERLKDVTGQDITVVTE